MKLEKPSILNIIYHRPKQWCDAHRTSITIALIAEMVILACIIPIQIHFRLVGDSLLSLVLILFLTALLILLLKIATTRQVIWAAVGLLTAGTVGYCVGCILTSHWITGFSIREVWRGF